MASKPKKKNKKQKLLKSEARKQLVLDIVQTDSAFERVTLRDGWVCWVGKCIHCNRKMTVGEDGMTSFTIEHIVPRSAGGDSSPENCALACAACNSKKGIDHDVDYDPASRTAKARRSHDVVSALQAKRLSRWRPKVIDDGD